MTVVVTEKQLQVSVVQLAKMTGWKVYHTFDSRRSQAGFPDLVLVKGDRLIFAELKRERGRPTPEQSEWLNELSMVEEVEAYIWRPQDWNEIEQVLRSAQL